MTLCCCNIIHAILKVDFIYIIAIIINNNLYNIKCLVLRSYYNYPVFYIFQFFCFISFLYYTNFSVFMVFSLYNVTIELQHEGKSRLNR